LQRLGGPGASGARVDPAQLELLGIVAADADPEREPARGKKRDALRSCSRRTMPTWMPLLAVIRPAIRS
jgi:hypothetical protein